MKAFLKFIIYGALAVLAAAIAYQTFKFFI